MITDSYSSKLTNYIWILYITILPILVYFSTTLFYKFSKTDNKVAIKEIDMEKMMSEYNNKYKDIANKIKISKGNVNYTLLKF
ncbi:MAG: hypothetical protein H7263_16620 [Candidatus Sericytochromatia bacterium]|nr:hypothetical protein [Candidatus Sericytochromatia bacterium]